MHEENLPDVDQAKSFELHEAEDVAIVRRTGKLEITIMRTLPGDDNFQSVTFVAKGNVYVMNNDGKTIESIALHPVKIKK